MPIAMTTKIKAFVLDQRIFIDREDAIEENFDGGDSRLSQEKYHLGRGPQTTVMVINFSDRMAMSFDPKAVVVFLDDVPQLPKRKYISVEGEGHTLYARARYPRYDTDRAAYVEARWSPGLPPRSRR